MWTIIGQTVISLFPTFSAKPNNDCLIQSLQWYFRLTKVSACFNNRCRLLEHVRSGGSAFLRVGKERCIKITLWTNFRVSRYIFVAKKTLLSETIFARDNCKENSILEWYIEQCLLKLVSQLQPSTTAIKYETCFWDVIRELCWRSTSLRVTKCFSSIMRGMQLVKSLHQEAGTKWPRFSVWMK